MHPVADLWRCTRNLNLPERVEHPVEYCVLLLFVGSGPTRRIQRLAQETRVTVQIGLHLRKDRHALGRREPLHHLCGDRLE